MFIVTKIGEKRAEFVFVFPRQYLSDLLDVYDIPGFCGTRTVEEIVLQRRFGAILLCAEYSFGHNFPDARC